MRLKTGLLICVFSLTLFIACNAGTEPVKAPKQAVPEKTVTVTDFTDSLSTLDSARGAVLDNALQLYNVMVPEDSTFADSAASALLQFIKRVVARKNDSLVTSTQRKVLPDSATGQLTDQQKSSVSALYDSRLKTVSDGEGGIQFVPLYETILPGIKNKTSAAIDTYLDLVAREDTTPTFLDAGLVIEPEELADRLVTSEQLMAQIMPVYFKSETEKLNRYYTRAFILGSDNSPSLEHNTTQLSEPFRKGYAYLLAKYPSTKASETTRAWMDVVATGDSKKMEAFRQSFR